MNERTRIGLTRVRQMQPGTELWDSDVTGFGARRQRSQAVAYVLLYRTADGRQRRYTIGRHGSPWTPETARDEARRLLGKVATGDDPAADKRARREAATMGDLLDHYLKDLTAGKILVRGGKPKKNSTLATDRGRIEGHMRPLLGKLPVAAVTRKDVELFMHAVADGKTKKTAVTPKKRGKSIVKGGRGTATRTMGLLGAIFSFSMEHGYRADNPARGVRKFAENKRDRRLSNDEYALLGKALAAAEAAFIWPSAIAAARFLVLTGWRSGEALALRHIEVDALGHTATLEDTKTGKSIRPLSSEALAIINAETGHDLVFRPSRGKTTMTGFGRFWDKIAALGPLPTDISPHVLRHSFASVAADLGYSEITIGALIGHKGQSITSRYVHAADAVLLAAADAVAAEILKKMGGLNRGAIND